jgi:hypothetical protein
MLTHGDVVGDIDVENQGFFIRQMVNLDIKKPRSLLEN